MRSQVCQKKEVKGKKERTLHARTDDLAGIPGKARAGICTRPEGVLAAVASLSSGAAREISAVDNNDNASI